MTSDPIERMHSEVFESETAWRPIDSAPDDRYILVRQRDIRRHPPKPKPIVVASRYKTIRDVWFDLDGKVIPLPDEWMEIPK